MLETCDIAITALPLQVVEVMAESVGPDLRWAVAQVKKAERVGRQQFADAKAAIEDDPWNTPTSETPPF